MSPWWLYPFLPLLGRGALPIGWLYVHVLSAKSIKPAEADLSAVVSYCDLSLTNQIDGTEPTANLDIPTTRRTGKAHGLSPAWNQLFSLPVYRVDGQLSISVHEAGLVGDEQLLEGVLPLATLLDANTHQLWLPMTGNGVHGQLQVRVGMKVSQAGRFWSFFLPRIVPAAAPPPDLDINVLICQAGRAQAIFLPPVMAGVGSVLRLLSWEQPIFSGCVYMAFVWLCFNPEWAPCALFALLSLMMLAHAPSAEFEQPPGWKLPEKPTAYQAPSNWTLAPANGILKMTSFGPSLASLQGPLGSLSDCGLQLGAVLQWREASSGAAVVAALAMLAVLFGCFEASSVALVFGVLVLTLFTRPMQAVLAVLGGIGGWLSCGVLQMEQFVARAISERQEQAVLDAARGEAGLISGGLVGGSKITAGVLNGVMGVLLDPLKGAKHGGVKGFVKGLGTGISGVVTKPVMGTYNGATSVGNGVANTIKLE